jgi:hypothetical protein
MKKWRVIRVAIHRSLDDLSKHLGTSSGMKMLLNKDNIKIALKQAGELLRESIQIYIDEFYDSYFPSTYVRTYNFENSLEISPVKSDGIVHSIGIYFNQDLATHPSLWGGEDGYLPFLLNDGWQWKNHSEVDIYRFSHYDGFHFIEKGIQRFNSLNRWGFKIILSKTYNGSTTLKEY